MWIVIAVWIVLEIWLIRILCNLSRNGYDDWSGGDILIAVGCFFIVPIVVIILLIACGKDCFRRKDKKMEEVYWNESLGQIVIKGGKCVYDKDATDRHNNEIDEYNGDVDSRESRIVAVEKQLTCSAKTQGKHKMVYVNTIIRCSQVPDWIIVPARGKPVSWVFRCSICGLEITKTTKELSPTERGHLKGLKLL